MNTYCSEEVNLCSSKKYSRRNRKVSKYKDKTGKIKTEFGECIIFANDISSKKQYIQRVCENSLKEQWSYSKSKNSRHKIYDMINGRYAKSLLSKALTENRFYAEKVKKEDGIYIFKKEDIHKFIITLLKAVERGQIRQFLDIPDVFYITRQLKKVGVEYYLS